MSQWVLGGAGDFFEAQEGDLAGGDELVERADGDALHEASGAARQRPFQARNCWSVIAKRHDTFTKDLSILFG